MPFNDPSLWQQCFRAVMEKAKEEKRTFTLSEVDQLALSITKKLYRDFYPIIHLALTSKSFDSDIPF